MTRTGTIGNEIELGIKFYNNGALFDPYDVGVVKIYTTESGVTSIASMSPTRISIGYYQISWSTPDTLSEGIYYDEWTWTAESIMASKAQRYCFTLTEESSITGTPDTPSAEAGCRPRPTWVQGIGARSVEDLGNGMGIKLYWGVALPADTNAQTHYNIYNATTRLGVFGDNNRPFAITTANNAIINVSPGNLHYFAVKATEFVPSEFDLTELDQVGTGLYQYPESLTLQNDIDAYAASISVEDTSDFSDKGFLLIDTEIMYYAEKDRTTFYVEDINRGAYSTTIDTHSTGATVELWHGIEDNNSLIQSQTATWHGVTPRNVDAIGQYNVDADGYRSANTDEITVDFSTSDANTVDFSNYDYTGYHCPSLQETFSGECVNSYIGGEFGGARGFNFQDRNLARLDAMLQTTGEGVILLRRKWTGKRCSCIGLRREHPRTRCEFCYGTSFDGGYDRYINNRAISETSRNVQGNILIRVSPYEDDLELTDGGLRHPSELTAWTISVPTLKDRDLVIRYGEDGLEEFRYEVLSVNRNRLFFGQTGKQEFKMRRLDKTDIVYTFTITDL